VGTGPRGRRRGTGTRLSNELQRPCLETVDWLSRKDPDPGPRATGPMPGQRQSAPTPSSATPVRRPAAATATAYRRRSGNSATGRAATSPHWSRRASCGCNRAKPITPGNCSSRPTTAARAASASLLQRLGNLYARNDEPLNTPRMSRWCHAWMPPPAPSCSAAWPKAASAMPCAGQSRPTPPRPASTAPWAAAPCPPAR
jgi:hypothetical protein